MVKTDEIKDVKGKEFVAAKILFLIAVIIFIVPISLILLLKFLYNVNQRAKVKIYEPIGFESQLERAFYNQ